MAFALPAIPLRMTDANGNVLAGAKLYVFDAGTTTPVNAYTTSALSVAHANPIVADSGGLFDEVFMASGTYKLRYTTSADVTLFEIDNYAVSVGGSDVTFPTAVKTANFTITADDQGKVFLCDASGAAGLNINAVADAEALGDGFPFFIVNTASTGTITLQGTGGQLVDGAASSTLSTQNGSYGFVSIGASGWQSVMRSGIAASTTEVLTGTDASKAVSADSLAALWEQGSDIASSGTISFGGGGYFFITGTTTITDMDFAIDKAGRRAWVKFSGVLTLTHSSTLILPGAANITTAAGDTALFVSEDSDVVRCLSYQRAAGSGPKVLRKAANQTVSSSTLTNDDTFTFSMDANTKYQGTIHLIADHDATSDFKCDITGPASPNAVSLLGKLLVNGSLCEYEVATALSTALSFGVPDATEGAIIDFYIDNGANAGTFNFRWCNRTGALSNDVIAGSYMIYQVVT